MADNNERVPRSRGKVWSKEATETVIEPWCDEKIQLAFDQWIKRFQPRVSPIAGKLFIQNHTLTDLGHKYQYHIQTACFQFYTCIFVKRVAIHFSA